MGLEPLQPLMDVPAVSEIMVNGPRMIFVERNGRKILSDAAFADEGALRALLDRLYAGRGKLLGADVPFGDMCLEDGTRVNAILGPMSRFGMAVTLRKFSGAVRTLDDLVALGTLTPNAARFLSGCIRGKVNV